MGVLTVVGIVVLAVAVVALIARFVPGINVAVVATAALAPDLMLGAPLAMIVLAVSRTWIAVAVAGVVTVATIAVQLPWYTRRRVEPGVVVRVVSANLRYGRADPEAVVRMARDHADILAVQELTPEKAELISAAGMDTVLPYQVLRARKGPDGVGIWSRFPMRRGAEYDEFGRGLLTTQVQIPEVAGEATVPGPAHGLARGSGAVGLDLAGDRCFSRRARDAGGRPECHSRQPRVSPTAARRLSRRRGAGGCGFDPDLQVPRSTPAAGVRP
jgi:hypothetical protein